MTLVVGSLTIGLGIGVVGVAITGVVRDHLPERAGAATGLYTVSMMGGATVASLTALPLQDALGGWWWALAAWTVPAVLALVVWWPAPGACTTSPRRRRCPCRGATASPASRCCSRRCRRCSSTGG